MAKIVALGRLLFLVKALVHPSFAFLPHTASTRTQRRGTAVFGLAEWRGRVVCPGAEGSSTRDRPILILPFKAEDALLPGQSRDLILKEGRLFDLVQDATDDHDSVLGAALLGDDGFLDILSLCEIHNFDVHSGYRGRVKVSITLRALTRARMTEIAEVKPIMKGSCREMVDDEVDDIASASVIIDDIESILGDLSRRKDWRNQRQLYDEAFALALESMSSAVGSGLSEDKRLPEISAASWAIFAVVRDKRILLKAMKITDTLERLRIGLKALLAEKYHMAPITDFNDADVGFE